MPSFWTEMMRVMKMRKLTTVVVTALGLLFIALVIHIGGIIYYYSDYAVLLLPNPPLPTMERPKENLQTADRSSIDAPAGAGGGDGREGRGVGSQDSPRILCLIVTSPNYHGERASHVAVTWARHCTKSVFLTTKRDIRLPNVILTPGAGSYRQLWGKVKQGFEWAYENRHHYDWIFKADDDTFAVIENLKSAVASLDPNEPQVTGNHLTSWETDSLYLNGGAGYVLSRAAVTKLVEEGLQTKACDHNLNLGTNEDVNMADCLTYLGVEFLDSRDSFKRNRFNVYPPQELVDPRQANSITHLWLKKKSVFPYNFGYSEMSHEVITFHYVNAQTMYLLYYLIYIVNPANADRMVPFQKVDTHKARISQRTTEK